MRDSAVNRVGCLLLFLLATRGLVPNRERRRYANRSQPLLFISVLHALLGEAVM